MIQLYDYGEALSIKGGNSRKSSALFEAHVMDKIDMEIVTSETAIYK